MKEQWNNFVSQTPGGSFLQSWEWGQMQEALHVPYWRLWAEEGGGTAAALVVHRTLPAGRCWLYVPRGPLVGSDRTAISHLQTELFDLGRRQRASFVRVEPHTAPSEPWRKAERDVQPRHTVMLDLSQSEEDLLAAMHQKTRYNIRLAERRGVTVRFSRNEADLSVFLTLLHDVQARGTFHYHPDGYFRAMVKTLGPHDMLELAVAEWEGSPLAAHILISFGDTVTYAHGASSNAQRQLMAPHLLQWASIQRARTHGKRWYDFFGVAPPEAGSDHSWAGITRFKEGFGGQRREYPGAYDLVLDPLWYWAYAVGRKARGLWHSW